MEEVVLFFDLEKGRTLMKKMSRFVVLSALIGCSCLFAECPLGCNCAKCQAKQEQESKTCPKGCDCEKCQAATKRNCCFSGTHPRFMLTGDHPADCTCPRCEVEREDQGSGCGCGCAPAERASVQGPLKETYPKIAIA